MLLNDAQPGALLTMKILVLNGSPRKHGAVATLMQAVVEEAGSQHEVEWVDVCELDMKPCIGCMKCRPDGECCLPEDDAHRVGRKINAADVLIVGTPTYWGNMSGQLKLLFDRIVPVFESVRSPLAMPTPRQKGKSAVIVTACTAPWPFNFILSQSRTAVQAVKIILKYGGYRIRGVLVQTNTQLQPKASPHLLEKARSVGRKL
jgi:putative NADPH-quinone reductase